MNNNKSGSGKGKRPIIGYNPKKWYEHFDDIDWRHNTKIKENNNERRNSKRNN
jgi:hypothetical protein